MTGVRSRPSAVVQVGSQVSSANVMAAACTVISASPGPGSGTGADSNTSCSGPPRACARRAVIVSAIASETLLGQPGQARVGHCPPAAVDGQAVPPVGELEQLGHRVRAAVLLQSRLGDRLRDGVV